MTRGIELPVAKKLLINGFLSEIFENISGEEIKTFLESYIISKTGWGSFELIFSILPIFLESLKTSKFMRSL